MTDTDIKKFEKLLHKLPDTYPSFFRAITGLAYYLPDDKFYELTDMLENDPNITADFVDEYVWTNKTHTAD